MERTSARDRLLNAASRLFYTKGLESVGITEITKEAQIARMTLYNLFDSKGELILAVLAKFLESRKGDINAAFNEGGSPHSKLALFFDIARVAQKDDCFRGCMFINAALQTSDPAGPVHIIARTHKIWIKTKLKENLFHTITDDLAEVKAQQILTIWDGAISEAYIQQSPKPIDYGVSAASDILSNSSIH